MTGQSLLYPWFDHRSLALITASPTYGKLPALCLKNEEFVIVSELWLWGPLSDMFKEKLWITLSI